MKHFYFLKKQKKKHDFSQIDYLNPPIEIIDNDISMAKCDTTMGNVINIFLKDLPILKNFITCTNPKCKKTIVTSIPIPYITVNVKNDNLDELENVVKLRINNETTLCGHVDDLESPCDGYKTIRTDVSKLHIFIELLCWNGK